MRSCSFTPRDRATVLYPFWVATFELSASQAPGDKKGYCKDFGVSPLRGFPRCQEYPHVADDRSWRGLSESEIVSSGRVFCATPQDKKLNS